MNIKTHQVAGNDNDIYLAIPHPDHKEYIKIVAINLNSLEVILDTPYISQEGYEDGKKGVTKVWKSA